MKPSSQIEIHTSLTCVVNMHEYLPQCPASSYQTSQ